MTQREHDHAAAAPPDLHRVAAEWHERLDEHGTSARVQAQFRAWLQADPRHAQAYAALDSGWSALADMGSDPRVQAMRREARVAGVPRRARQRRMLALAASVLVAAMGGWVALAWLPAPAVAPMAGTEYHTVLGQRSTVALADGSTVDLNTDSRIVVDYAPELRRIRLLQGQAWFEVAKDAQRPFVVEAGGQRVTALGTAFDVRLDPAPEAGKHTVQVTLVEGRVTVQEIPSRIAAMLRPEPAKTELAPGELLRTHARAALPDKRKADLAKVTGWREGQLMFDGDTLAAAVAEVNRYSSIRIELSDPALADLRVSGVFKTGHARSFLETVSGHYPIAVSEEGPDRVVLTRR